MEKIYTAESLSGKEVKNDGNAKSGKLTASGSGLHQKRISREEKNA